MNRPQKAQEAQNRNLNPSILPCVHFAGELSTESNSSFPPLRSPRCSAFQLRFFRFNRWAHETREKARNEYIGLGEQNETSSLSHDFIRGIYVKRFSISFRVIRVFRGKSFCMVMVCPFNYFRRISGSSESRAFRRGLHFSELSLFESQEGRRLGRGGVRAQEQTEHPQVRCRVVRPTRRSRRRPGRSPSRWASLESLQPLHAATSNERNGT